MSTLAAAAAAAATSCCAAALPSRPTLSPDAVPPLTHPSLAPPPSCQLQHRPTRRCTRCARLWTTCAAPRCPPCCRPTPPSTPTRRAARRAWPALLIACCEPQKLHGQATHAAVPALTCGGSLTHAAADHDPAVPPLVHQVGLAAGAAGPAPARAADAHPQGESPLLLPLPLLASKHAPGRLAPAAAAAGLARAPCALRRGCLPALCSCLNCSLCRWWRSGTPRRAAAAATASTESPRSPCSAPCCAGERRLRRGARCAACVQQRPAPSLSAPTCLPPPCPRLAAPPPASRFTTDAPQGASRRKPHRQEGDGERAQRNPA